MNKELINKIRLDAGIARLNDSYDYAVVSLNREGKVIDPLEGLEIFAELIVKECLEVMRNNYYSDPHHVIEAEEHIKTHFGVTDGEV
jgi:hypothetical protein